MIHFLLQPIHELLFILWQAQSFVVGVSPIQEIGRQVLIGIAVTIRSHHPDFLASEPLAQDLQNTNLIYYPVNPAPAIFIFIVDRVRPRGRDDATDRNSFLW